MAKRDKPAADGQLGQLEIAAVVSQVQPVGWGGKRVSGFMIAFARRLNMMLQRKGKVWGDRWHGHELASPSEVRHVFVNVFGHLPHQGEPVADPRTWLLKAT